MNSKAVPDRRADRLLFAHKPFLAIVLASAVLLAAASVAFDKGVGASPFLSPILTVQICGALLFLRLAVAITGWLVAGNSPYGETMTKIDAALIGIKIASMLAAAVLAICTLLAFACQAEFAHTLLRALIELVLFHAVMLFLIGAVVNTEGVVARLRERRGRRNAGS